MSTVQASLRWKLRHPIRFWACRRMVRTSTIIGELLDSYAFSAPRIAGSQKTNYGVGCQAAESIHPIAARLS